MSEDIFRALEGGATLVTASRRLARALTQDFHAFEQDQGRPVWNRPDILPLDAFLDRQWRDWVWRGANEDSLTLLDALQEQVLWEQVIRESKDGASLLSIPETARHAMQAWRLVHAYRLPVDGRFEASDDWAAFADWSRSFQRRCQTNLWLDRARLADFVVERLGAEEIARPSALYIAGFDDLNPQQADLLRALGKATEWTERGFDAAIGFEKLRDSSEEIRRAAVWARQLLEQDPGTQVGIIVQDLTRLRPSVERIFREVLHPASDFDDRERSFHVSLGPQLDEYPLVYAALLILEFALGSLTLPRAGMLLRSPFLAGAEAEWTKRALLDKRLRRHGIWELSIPELRAEADACPQLQRALRRFEKVLQGVPEEQRASDWGRDFSRLLEALGWPGDRPLSSREYQVLEAWHGQLSKLGALDLAASPMTFAQALARLQELTSEVSFQIENEGAPVQVMGLLEATGLRFDHLWIMGLHDQALPAPANPNSFLPISLQREHQLPHSSAAHELEFGSKLLTRLLASAPEVMLSYPSIEGEHAFSPSPLLPPHQPPATSPKSPAPRPQPLVLEELNDDLAPEVMGAAQVGGASLFKDMAACPFRAFAKHRLGARPLEESSLGLSYKDRGTTVHKALQLIWNELGSHARLTGLGVEELRELVERCAASAVEHLSNGIGRNLEKRRLGKLLADWLEIEKSRDPFRVVKSEEENVVSIGGLEIKTRADRVDELANGRDIILDYKTGQVKSKAWDTERPDEPQLPLYCATSQRPIAGAAFAVIRTGELAFRGKTEDGVTLPDLKKMWFDQPVALNEQIDDWKRVLERLAADFRAGRAEVDPKRGACEYCGLWALCRIRETAPESSAPE